MDKHTVRDRFQRVVARADAKEAAKPKPPAARPKTPPQPPRPRRTRSKTRLARQQDRVHATPEIIYPEDDNLPWDTLLERGDPRVVAEARRLIDALPNEGLYVRRKAREMQEAFKLSQGSERQARNRVLALAVKLVPRLEKYERFALGGPEEQFVVVTRGMLSELVKHLNAKPSRQAGWTPPGLAKFLHDVVGHPEGFNDEDVARLVAAACGATTGAKPRTPPLQ